MLLFILEYSEAESLMGNSFFFKISFVYKVCVRERGAEGGMCRCVLRGQSEELAPLQGYSPDYQLQACQANPLSCRAVYLEKCFLCWELQRSRVLSLVK